MAERRHVLSWQIQEAKWMGKNPGSPTPHQSTQAGCRGWAPSPNSMKTGPRSWKGMQSAPNPAPFASVSFDSKALCSSAPKSTHRRRRSDCLVFPLHDAKITPWQNIILAVCSESMLSIFRMLIMGSGGIFSGPNGHVIKLNIHASEGN